MPQGSETEKKVLTSEYKKECIEKLKRMLKEESRFQHIELDDVYFERYLHGTEFDVDAGFTKMKMFYDALLDHPKWYRILAPLELKPLIEKPIRLMIPECDKEGRPIYIVKLGNINVRTMDILDVIGVDDIWLESLFLCDSHASEKGLCVLVDIANYPWSMIKWLTPGYIRLSLGKLLSLPFKDFRFHIINNSRLLQTTLKILWPFLPEHIKEMVKFHFDNWNSLSEHIDPKVLPVEYGGIKDVNYNQIYSQLYDRNEEIHTSFKLYRTFNKENI